MRLATVGTDRIGLIEADRITDVTPVVGIGGTMSAMRRLIEACADAGGRFVHLHSRRCGTPSARRHIELALSRVGGSLKVSVSSKGAVMLHTHGKDAGAVPPPPAAHGAAADQSAPLRGGHG